MTADAPRDLLPWPEDDNQAPPAGEDPYDVASAGRSDPYAIPASIFDANSFPMAEAAGIPWRSDGQPVEWEPRPGSLFDGRPWTRASGAAGVASPPWAGEIAAEAVAEEEHSDGGRRARAIVREVVETSLLALLVFLCVRATFQNFKVDGTSMYPTLENGEFLVVNKLIYAEVNVEKIARWVPFFDAGDDPIRHVFGGPTRGDIIVLKHPAHPETDLIKRIIGLPGETLEVKNNQVYINGKALEEPYIVAPGGPQQNEVRIPEGEYFVMGDNRAFSSDSRSFGLAPEELIIGRTVVTYWPTSKFGFAPNEEGHVLAAMVPIATASTAPIFGAHTAVFVVELLVIVVLTRAGSRAAARGVAQLRKRPARDNFATSR